MTWSVSVSIPPDLLQRVREIAKERYGVEYSDLPPDRQVLCVAFASEAIVRDELEA